MLSSADLLSHPLGVSSHQQQHQHHHHHHLHHATLHHQHHQLPSSCRHNYQQHQANAALEHRMDHTSATGDCEQPWTSLNSLSSELLVLIYQQLRDLDKPSLWNARLISRRSAAIATPILYRELEFNKKLVTEDAESTYPRLREHIQQYTLEAAISSDLDPAGIRRVLHWTTRLSSIRWRYNFSNFSVGQPWILSEALDVRQLQSSGTELHVENLPLREHAAVDFDDALTRVIPANLLVSLKLGRPAPPLTTKLAPLKQLLLRATRLHSLHYEDRGQGTSFKFQEDERMPAVKDLLLRSYDWDHSRREVARHWDFSNIRSLQLVHVPSYNFLSSINPNDLRKLHTLRVEDASAHLPDKRREATRALTDLVSSYIDALETLDLVCHLPLFSLDALLVHRHTLQILRLRDHVGFGEEDHVCPTVDSLHLAGLAKELRYLHTLELDLDVTQCDPREFLSAACRFGNLQTLTVHVQTLLRPLEAVEAGTDRDFEAAMQSFQFLIQERERLSKLQDRCYKPWKRITINVGGWRRVMVRRVSAAWRERNERGIFAERCFVMERSAHGQVGVREEIGLESPSRRATPEL